MNKKTLTSLLILVGILVPSISYGAFGVGFNATSTTQGDIYPNAVNGVHQRIGSYKSIFAPFFTGTSTTATSTFRGNVAFPSSSGINFPAGLYWNPNTTLGVALLLNRNSDSGTAIQVLGDGESTLFKLDWYPENNLILGTSLTVNGTATSTFAGRISTVSASTTATSTMKGINLPYGGCFAVKGVCLPGIINLATGVTGILPDANGGLGQDFSGVPGRNLFIDNNGDPAASSAWLYDSDSDLLTNIGTFRNNGNVGINILPSYALEVNGAASTTLLNLPKTASASVGGIYFGGVRVMSNFGTNNFFLGNSGNLTLSGTDNTALGEAALDSVTSGSNNFAFGANALTALTTAVNNTAIGVNSQITTTGGSFNTSIGGGTLQSSTGRDNVAIGYGALQLGISDYSVGIGVNSGQNNNTIENIFIGYVAGQNVTDGYRNVIMGSWSGSTLTTGIQNTLIGSFSNVGASDLTNATAIGFNAQVGASNSLVLGNGANVGIGTSSPYARLSVVGPSGVVADKYYATSTMATSTFAGAVMVGTTTPGNYGNASAELLVSPRLPGLVGLRVQGVASQTGSLFQVRSDTDLPYFSVDSAGVTNMYQQAQFTGPTFAQFQVSTAGVPLDFKTVAGAGDITFTPGNALAATFHDTGTTTLVGALDLNQTTKPIVGNAVLVAGTVTVTTGSATANSYLLVTRKTSGGTLGTAITYTITNGSFTITSDSALDTSTMTWLLIN